MQTNRRNESHHYVPQFYLRQWCEADGKLWVYPVDGRPGFRAAPKSFAAENGLYDSSDIPEFGTTNEEAQLSAIESLFAPRWPAAFDGTGDARTKMNLCRFLALLHLRHPRQKEDIRMVNAMFRRIAEHAGGQEQIEIRGTDGTTTFVKVSDIHRFASDTEESTKIGFLLNMRASVEELAKILHARKWGVLSAFAPVFVTSDAPVFLSRGTATKDKFGFGTPGTVVSFPISPTKLLRISDEFAEDGLHYQLTALGGLNDYTVLGADRFVFSPAEFKEPTHRRSS